MKYFKTIMQSFHKYNCNCWKCRAAECFQNGEDNNDDHDNNNDNDGDDYGNDDYDDENA